MMFKIEKPILIMQKCENCSCFFFSMVQERVCCDCVIKEIESGEEKEAAE